MNDPLAQFRKKPAVTAEPPPPPPREPEGYVAFDSKDKVERVKIRRAFAPTRAPAYSFLLDLAYDGTYGTNFVLVFSFMMVKVKGRNLQGVVMALENRMADFIQEFDPAKWEKPKDAKAPFIERIEVIVNENGDAVAEAEKVSTMPKLH